MIKLFIFGCIGLLAGSIITNIFWLLKCVGTLYINTSGEKDIWRFAVEDLEEIKKHKKIVLVVKNDPNLDSLDKQDL